MAGLARAPSHKVSVLQWIKRSVARQTGIIVAGSLASAALVVWLLDALDVLPDVPVQVFVLGLACIVPAAALLAGWVNQRLVGSRLAHLVEVIDGAGPHDDLARIKDLGADEVGEIGQAVNRLLARITSIRASMIDQARQLGEAQRELELKARLAEKTQELSQRLEERSMLFDIMRITSSTPVLSDVLNTLVERVCQMLHMREVVIFLHDRELEGFEVQATAGFARKNALRGRTLKLGEGISGKAGQTREPCVVEDLSKQDGYLGFWGEAERTGSLAALPILYRDRLLGVLTVTRPEHEPITELHLRLLLAITDHAALAIANAQLFERMRELSAHDELTGLPNHRHLRSHLEREIDRARRFDKPFSALVIEVDNLRELEEQAGADAVEKTLRELAGLLIDNVRKVDTVARVGDEQFAVLLPRADLVDASGVGEKLRNAVVTSLLSEQAAGAAGERKLTVSIGVAQLSAEDDAHGESLVTRAKQGLQVARQGGRNRVCATEPAAAGTHQVSDAPSR